MARETSKKKNLENSINKAEDKAVDAMDELSEYQDFKENILPALREDLQKGMSAEDIRKKYSGYVQAAMLTTALTDSDASKRIAAAKDIIDRSEGKPTESKEVRHSLEKMPEEQLDSILWSKLQDGEEDKKEDNDENEARH